MNLWPAYGALEYLDGSSRGGTSARVHVDDRARERERKRRKRATAFERAREAGTVTLAEVIAHNRARIRAGRCPLGCTCRDCLFPETKAQTPRVVRFTGGAR